MPGQTSQVGATLTMKIINKIIQFIVRTPTRDWQNCDFICRNPSGALYYDRGDKRYFIEWNEKANQSRSGNFKDSRKAPPAFVEGRPY